MKVDIIYIVGVFVTLGLIFGALGIGWYLANLVMM